MANPINDDHFHTSSLAGFNYLDVLGRRGRRADLYDTIVTEISKRLCRAILRVTDTDTVLILHQPERQ